MGWPLAERAGALAALLLVIAALLLPDARAQERSYAGRVPAPAFPAGLDWINTGGEPLALDQLGGKVVLLDFWTYGCINCFHVIPDLERLEGKYPDSLVVIGVHSAKFAHEARTPAIRSVVQRYDLSHPVVNDRDMEIWRAYGARAWPTLALVDPAGNYVGDVAGEGHYALLDEVIGGLVAEFDAAGKLDRGPLPVEAGMETGGGLLRYPGKVLADPEGGRVFIADSNHHRIVVADPGGRVLQFIGDGTPGYRDGPAGEARFHYPQGLALAGPDRLYVADVRNNLVRVVDLDGGEVGTVAGTGQRAYQTAEEGPALETALNSPWDLAWHEDLLYIAMAGQHQVWVLDPGHGRLSAFAGSRREELKDGPRLAAGLNQPSGLAWGGGRLWIADSEASAVRVADPAPDGRVATVVGVGLFEFGDVDGTGAAVRLQHPLGIAWHDGVLYVADTYNSKIKRVDPDTRSSHTFLGSEAGLDEPGGLSVGDGRLYIADTNKHRIMVVDLATGELAPLELRR